MGRQLSISFAGYFFGNFTMVIFVIIILSVMPGVIEFVKHRMETRKK